MALTGDDHLDRFSCMNLDAINKRVFSDKCDELALTDGERTSIIDLFLIENRREQKLSVTHFPDKRQKFCLWPAYCLDFQGACQGPLGRFSYSLLSLP